MSVLVAGSLHLDVVLRAPHLPRLDETVAGSGVGYVFGGKGGTQAVAASRMGADVSLAGRIGQDHFGEMIREALVTAGVDIGQLQQDPGASGMSAAIVEDGGEYGAVIVSGANARIDAKRIAEPVGTSLVLLQNEVPEAVNLTVARPLSSDLVETLDLLIVNRVEAAFYAGSAPDVRTLTTLGPDGASFHGTVHPGHRVDLVSAHGAGDMFLGSLAACVAAGTDLADAVPFAQAAAALHVSTPLAARSALDADAVRRFMAAQDSP